MRLLQLIPCFLGTLVLFLALTPYCHSKPGFYSVAKTDGVWWFIDPAGKPFYSLGVCDIGPGPSLDRYDPTKPCYAALRHYDSKEAWAKETLQRLTAWHFNTIGGWADESLTHGSFPYAVVLHMGAEVGFPWNDVFADGFFDTLDRFAKRRVAPRSGDSSLIGWYTDNELSWYPDTLFAYHLRQPASSRTRSKLIELLADEYDGSFAALTQDFEVVGAGSFEELAQAGQLMLRPESGGRRVILKFAGQVAERYYRSVHDAVRRYDSNHLILGDRYARHCPEVVARAAAPYVDVISTNMDLPDASDGYLPGGYLRDLHRITGRPVLVTEYYVAAQENRSGNKNTGNIFLTVSNQEERRAAAETRLRGLVGRTYVIGAHWFRYADEPTHGRSDGEDYNFGLVDLDDRPYERLTAAFANLNSEVPALHRASSASNIESTRQIDIPYCSVTAADLHKQLTRTKELALDDNALQVHQLLAAWTDSEIYVVALLNYLAQKETYSATSTQLPHQLELRIASPGFDAPLRIPIPATDGKSDISGTEFQLRTSGMHQTMVVAIPASKFGRKEFSPNDRVQLEIAVKDLLNRTTASTDVELRLAEGIRSDTAVRPSPASD